MRPNRQFQPKSSVGMGDYQGLEERFSTDEGTLNGPERHYGPAQAREIREARAVSLRRMAVVMLAIAAGFAVALAVTHNPASQVSAEAPWRVLQRQARAMDNPHDPQLRARALEAGEEFLVCKERAQGYDLVYSGHMELLAVPEAEE